MKEKLIENQKAKNQEVPDEAFLDMLMRCQVMNMMISSSMSFKKLKIQKFDILEIERAALKFI